MAVFIYQLVRLRQPPLEISSAKELSDNKDKKVKLLARRIFDTEVEISIMTFRRFKNFHFYITELDSQNVVLVAKNLRELEYVEITGVVTDLHNKNNSVGKAFKKFKKSYTYNGRAYHRCCIEVIGKYLWLQYIGCIVFFIVLAAFSAWRLMS